MDNRSALPGARLDTAATLIPAKALRHRVVFSLQHIYRLEERGEFPARVRIGVGRIAWRLADVMAWMQAKLEARGPCPFNAKGPLLISPSDRFIGKTELKLRVLYSHQHVRLLELEGLFPGRIRIGENRVAWLEREIDHWLDVRPRVFERSDRLIE